MEAIAVGRLLESRLDLRKGIGSARVGGASLGLRSFMLTWRENPD